MIGALTLILEHWCGTVEELADKHELILMNMKCRNMSEYEEFHKDWTQRNFEVQDSQNLLWKQVYLEAIPSKFVEYLKMQEVFKLPYVMYTCREIYSLITKALIGLCVNMKVHNSVNKLSHFPDRKSICEKYGLYISGPVKRKRKKKKEFKEKKKERYKYRYRPKTHYYEPEDIKLRSHSHQARQQVHCWIYGKDGHIAHKCLENKASRMSKGKYSEQKDKEAQASKQLALRLHCNRCGANDHETNQCPHHPFPKREEVHLLQQGCCSESTSTSEFDYSSEEEILMNHDCSCKNPNYCSCQDSSQSSESESEPALRQKIKVCMFSTIGDQEAQMLAQIKALPEGDMKNSLLETFLKTVKT
jgi:hypothetical protein